MYEFNVLKFVLGNINFNIELEELTKNIYNNKIFLVSTAEYKIQDSTTNSIPSKITFF